MDSQSEQQPNQNPEQIERDKWIKVIDELSESARYLQDPRLLTFKSTPEDIIEKISYESADKSKFLDLKRDDIIRTRDASSNIPKLFQEYEKILPITCITSGFYETTPMFSIRQVWLNLEKDNPKVFQLFKEDGYYLPHNEPLTGREIIKERPEFLPHILEAASGKKTMFKSPIGRPSE